MTVGSTGVLLLNLPVTFPLPNPLEVEVLTQHKSN